tara:strand:+ start:192 stop:542 length:351 start_codon:yes stop_codon:yes gene_type:complete
MTTRKINDIEYPVPGIDTAIKILRPNAKYELYNTEFINWECPDGSEPPSWDEVVTEIKREVDIYNYYLYERQREKLYPDWKAQMDMLYHDIKNNNLENGSWIQSIDTIKSTYPKPE